jgi:hypothetical protein
MTRLIAVFALLCAFILTSPALAGADPNPSTCEGYPEPRVPLKAQSWFRGTDDLITVRHVHSEACFPYMSTLDGELRLDVVTKLHEYPGWMLRFVRVYACADEDGCRTLEIVDLKTQTCASVDCAFVTTVTVDLAALTAGTYEFRLHSEVRKDAVSGKPWNLATTGWLACVRSCQGVTPQAVDPPETQGRGYYRTQVDGHIRGYFNGTFEDPLPWDPETGLYETKSGTWCPNVRADKGAGDEPVTGHFVTVDPDFHHGSAGRVLLEGPGEYDGPVCIDTTALADGLHSLFIQSTGESASIAGSPEQLWGAVVIPFRTANGTPAPEPTPTPAPTAIPEPIPEPCPAVTVTAPAEGDIDTNPVLFNATAVGAASIEYIVDSQVIALDGTADNGFAESATLPAGAHTVAARATVGGLACASPPISFTVDN